MPVSRPMATSSPEVERSSLRCMGPTGVPEGTELVSGAQRAETLGGYFERAAGCPLDRRVRASDACGRDGNEFAEDLVAGGNRTRVVFPSDSTTKRCRSGGHTPPPAFAHRRRPYAAYAPASLQPRPRGICSPMASANATSTGDSLDGTGAGGMTSKTHVAAEGCRRGRNGRGVCAVIAFDLTHAPCTQ